MEAGSGSPGRESQPNPKNLETVLCNDLEAIFDIRDGVSFMLALHLRTECWLEGLVSSYLPAGSSLFGDRSRLTYAEKLNLVVAFDVLETRTSGALRALNSFRNRLVHGPIRVSREEVDKIGRILGDEYDKRVTAHEQGRDSGSRGAFNVIGGDWRLLSRISALYWTLGSHVLPVLHQL